MDNLPPGFHFSPSDEELVGHFLYRKVARLPCHPDIIPTLDLTHCDPWELHGKALQSGNCFYFFSRKNPNRASSNGYWQASEADEPVVGGGDIIGKKKTFVFYETFGGNNTNWMMHEYQLLDGTARYNSSSSSGNNSRRSNKRKDPKIECKKWVLCRVFEANGDPETELSCLDEVFLSLDDLDEISLLK